MNFLSTTFNLQKVINFNHQIGLLCCRRRPSLNCSIHQYRNTVPWENAVELSEHLIRTVVHHDNGLLVLNKPYGVTFSRSGNSAQIQQERKGNPEEKVFKKQTQKQSKEFTDNQYYTSGIVNDSLSLIDCLPYIKKYFGYNKLYISRVPGKFVSGVAILTTSSDLVDKINDIHVRPPTGKDTYLAVVVGVPRYTSGVLKLGLKLEKHSKIGKKVVVLPNWSNNACKRGDVRIGTFHHQTVCRGFNDLTSLVEVRVDLRKYNALRVFAADHLLAPVLGDNMFGGRVQTLLGVPTNVHHFSEAALRPQKLPEEVYSLLEVDPGSAGIIPVHTHLSDMVLPKLLNGKPLHLKAPPPTHFEWTCNKLGLSQQQEAVVAV